MMRLPKFRYAAPRSIADAVAALADHGPEAMVIAGGTDLVPNMKRRQQKPKLLIGLRRVAELAERRNLGTELALGAGMRLADLVADAEIRATHPALWRAAAQVATPLIRNQATLGGNVCLDTRCNYYNQNYEWRQAIDYCMKAPASEDGLYKAGDFVGDSRTSGEEKAEGIPRGNVAARGGEEKGAICWVAPGSPRCWAVSSSDTAPALIALGADIELVSRSGSRRLPLENLYHNDGMAYLTKQPDELLTRIFLPHVLSDATGGSPAGQWTSTYWKLRRRDSFDFPVLGLAAAVRLDSGGVVEDARLVLGAVASRPLLMGAAADILVGHALTDERIEACVEAVYPLAKPLDNTDFTLAWRKAVTRSFVQGALRELRGDDPAALGPLARHARRDLPTVVV